MQSHRIRELNKPGEIAMYEDCSKEELKELLKKYMDLKHPKPNYTRKFGAIIIMACIAILPVSILSIVSWGASWTNCLAALASGFGLYIGHDKENTYKFYCQQIVLIQNELDNRT